MAETGGDVMTEIIYGFIIAIWVTLNLIYFRLGFILDELEKKNDGNNKNNDIVQDPGGK